MIRDHAKGFTLIEIVVTLVLLGVITGFVGMPLISMITARATINEKVGQDADAMFALEKISNEIRFGPEPGCNDNSVTAHNGKKMFRYEYDGTNETLTAVPENAEPGSESVMLTGVENFSCVQVSDTLNLYELTLDLKTQIYSSRAYWRDLP